MSRISLVIPMYNEARHIGRTLLAAQRAANAAGLECELIVADNGSKDQGPHIARQMGAQVLVLPGLLIGALRNRGAAVATGEWLAFIDADIEMPEDWLTLLLSIQPAVQVDVLGLDLHTPAEAPWYANAWQRRTLRPNDETVKNSAMAAQFQPVDASSMVRQGRRLQRKTCAPAKTKISPCAFPTLAHACCPSTRALPCIGVTRAVGANGWARSSGVREVTCNYCAATA